MDGDGKRANLIVSALCNDTVEIVNSWPRVHTVTGAGAIDVFQQADPGHYAAVARIQVGAGAGSTSFHFKTRSQDSLFMSWLNMLPQGGSEVLLFDVND
jgi:hypothetical protein